MGYIVADTETTSLTKPFCYDVGYMVFNDKDELQVARHYVVEQTWHNLPLFESAYYKDKRPLYVKLMRQHKAIMEKWGYIMRQMKTDIRNYDVTAVYAYNSDFDDKVFTFNCDWFKCNNPLEDIPVYDIWGYVSQFISNTQDYRNFCDEYEYYTDSGNYAATAEIVFRYLTKELTFEEAHMGLHDTYIESFILQQCFGLGAEREHEYKVTKILPREQNTPYTIKVNGKVLHTGIYKRKYIRNNVYNFFEEP